MPDFEEFSKYFYYDETSPSCLRRKVDILINKHKTGVRYSKDSPAGYCDPKGYWKVIFKYRSYKVHRIVMILNGFDISGKEVDHIDRDRSNNKISNLRLVSRSENMRNKSKYKNNLTGHVGVHIKHRCGIPVGVVATWSEGKKKCKKEFSIAKYGLDAAINLAHEFRLSALEKLKSSGDIYHEQHWK